MRASAIDARRLRPFPRTKALLPHWSVNSELPSVESFEAATQYVREEDLAESIPAGPDPEVHLAAIGKFVDAGFDHVALLGIGPDQAAFIRFAEKELLPKLR